jgi:hypothetical protein
MIHSCCDDFLVFFIEADVSNERFVAFELAIRVGIKRIKDDIVFIRHKDQKMLIFMNKRIQLSNGHFGMNDPFESKMLEVNNQDYLLRDETDDDLFP